MSRLEEMARRNCLKIASFFEKLNFVILYISAPHLLEKLRSIRQWLDTTQDATAYDYIYRVNKGKC